MPDRPLPSPQLDASPVPSPCVRNCCLDDDDICMGCFRSLQEIIAWGSASDDQRRRILEQARLRKPYNRD
jgi:predicted Fe-S protein YdhL (DUF1289 family)